MTTYVMFYPKMSLLMHNIYTVETKDTCKDQIRMKTVMQEKRQQCNKYEYVP